MRELNDAELRTVKNVKKILDNKGNLFAVSFEYISDGTPHHCGISASCGSWYKKSALEQLDYFSAKGIEPELEFRF